MTNGRAQLIGLGKCLNFIAKGGVSQSRLEERPHCWPLRAFYNLITLELSPERGQENRGVKKSGIVQTFAEANEMNPSQTRVVERIASFICSGRYYSNLYIQH